MEEMKNLSVGGVRRGWLYMMKICMSIVNKYKLTMSFYIFHLCHSKPLLKTVMWITIEHTAKRCLIYRLQSPLLLLVENTGSFYWIKKVTLWSFLQIFTWMRTCNTQKNKLLTEQIISIIRSNDLTSDVSFV
jgi:hypothetical protein